MKLSLKSALFEDVESGILSKEQSSKVSAGDEISITGNDLDYAKIKVVQKMIYQSIKSLTKSDEITDLLKSYSDKIQNNEEVSEEEEATFKKAIEEFGKKPFGVIDPSHIKTISNKQTKASGPVSSGSRLNPLNIKKNDSQVLGATNYDINKSKNLGGFFILVTSKEGDSISGVNSSKGAFTIAFFVPASGRILDDNNQEDKKIKELLNTFKQANGDTDNMYGKTRLEAITLGSKIYYLSILENDLEDFKAAIASNNTAKIIAYIKTKANPNIIRPQSAPAGQSNESFIYKTPLKKYLFETASAQIPEDIEFEMSGFSQEDLHILELDIKNKAEKIKAYINNEEKSSTKLDKDELEYLRNWHWMWSKFYFNKKYNGFFQAFIFMLPSFLSSILKILLFTLLLNNKKRKIYQFRFSGILNSIIGKTSWYRIKD